MIEISDDVLDHLVHAKKVAVLTGAGISAESGIATFRGKNGIWSKLKPEELASMDGFLQNPARVLEWYEHRRTIVENVQPNAAHTTLAEMQNYYEEFVISTQNIDGLHVRAGSTTVYELHGNIMRNRCNECGRRIENIDLDAPLKCQCGGLIRPDVVWFGEMLPIDVLDKSFAAAQHADVYFSIGTSAAVYPAAYLPIEAKNCGAFVIEINLEPTELSALVDVSFRGKAGDALPSLWHTVKTKIEQSRINNR